MCTRCSEKLNVPGQKNGLDPWGGVCGHGASFLSLKKNSTTACLCPDGNDPIQEGGMLMEEEGHL